MMFAAQRGLDLEELPVVDDARRYLVHVVGLRRLVRDRHRRARRPAGHSGRTSRAARASTGCSAAGAQGSAARSVIASASSRAARCATPLIVGVDRCAAQMLAIDILVRHRFHDLGSGDEHVARPLDHDREVGDGRRVDGAAGTRPQDQRDLRHDPGRQRVAQEDVGVAAERHDAFLDSRAARIIQADDRRADLDREVHHLADLLGVRFRQRSAENREVLAEDEHEPAVDRAVTGDDAVAQVALAVQAEVSRAVRDERVQLDERIRVEQQLQSLARRQLAAIVLLLDPLLSPAETRLFAQ